jgi:hypothetical protein
MPACPSCGVEHPSGKKFCPACGTALAAPPSPALAAAATPQTEAATPAGSAPVQPATAAPVLASPAQVRASSPPTVPLPSERAGEPRPSHVTAVSPASTPVVAVSQPVPGESGTLQFTIKDRNKMAMDLGLAEVPFHRVR